MRLALPAGFWRTGEEEFNDGSLARGATLRVDLEKYHLGKIRDARELVPFDAENAPNEAKKRLSALDATQAAIIEGDYDLN